MKLKPRPSSLIESSLSGPVRLAWLFPWLAGCGFSAEINQALSSQEVSLEKSACAQIVSHSDLIVSTLQGALPASAMALPLPNSDCELSLTDTPLQKSLQLQTPHCTINTPTDAKSIDLQMSVSAISLAATAASAGGTFVLSGGGTLDIQASLPLIGAYTGTVKYTLADHSSFDPTTGQLDLNLLMTYQSGPSVLPIAIAVSGTQSSITGTMTGPSLSCTVSGSLDTPVIACQ